MAIRRNPRISTTLLLGLLPALVVGAALLLHNGTTTATAPATSTVVRRVAAFPTALPATMTQSFTPTPTDVTANAPITPPAAPSSPSNIPTATIPPATPTPTPALPMWVIVGQWHGADVVFTVPFTVTGPWRIRWQLSAPTELFQVMIEEGQITPILYTGDAGATNGVVDNPRGGTYTLMLHNTIPYDVIVEQLRTP